MTQQVASRLYVICKQAKRKKNPFQYALAYVRNFFCKKHIGDAFPEGDFMQNVVEYIYLQTCVGHLRT